MFEQGIGYFIFLSIWTLFIGVSLYLIAKTILSQINSDLGKPKEEDKIKSTNPFDKSNRTEKAKQIRLERGFSKYISLISVITVGGFFGIVFFLYADSFIGFVASIQEYKSVSYPVGILLTIGLGATFMRGLLNGLGDENELFDTEDNLILDQRTKGVVMTYLSTAFFALLFAFVGGFSSDYNLIKATSLGFVVGNGFYLLLRYNTNWNKLKKYSFTKNKNSANNSEDESNLIDL